MSNPGNDFAPQQNTGSHTQSTRRLGSGSGGESDYWTLEEGYLAGCWIAEVGNVNLDDLVRAGNRPGAIVRVMRQGALQYIPPSSDDYERIAGLISDAA